MKWHLRCRVQKKRKKKKWSLFDIFVDTNEHRFYFFLHGSPKVLFHHELLHILRKLVYVCCPFFPRSFWSVFIFFSISKTSRSRWARESEGIFDSVFTSSKQIWMFILHANTKYDNNYKNSKSLIKHRQSMIKVKMSKFTHKETLQDKKGYISISYDYTFKYIHDDFCPRKMYSWGNEKYCDSTNDVLISFRPTR